MNDADLSDPRLAAKLQIIREKGLDLLRAKGMQIEDICDGKYHGRGLKIREQLCDDVTVSFGKGKTGEFLQRNPFQAETREGLRNPGADKGGKGVQGQMKGGIGVADGPVGDEMGECDAKLFPDLPA